MVDSRNILPLQQDSTKCGFGHFYYAITPKNPELVAIWKPMEEKHRKFHTLLKLHQNYFYIHQPQFLDFLF